ncbi:formyl transferase [Sulfitobacter sp. JB4-11]|uniref:formyl transferase n=1 Tax=Sulfitobacter rhodophyticola TaxID=3238304 RepID=UPI003D816B93
MKLTLLATDGPSTRILRNYLLDSGYTDVETIMEQAISRRALLAHRRRKLGTLSVFGQMAFMALVVPVLKRLSALRRSQILAHHSLRDDAQADNTVCVSTINDAEVVRRLERRQPDAVLVNGTRIIRRPILEAVTCPVINIHAGIAPQYRGVHGGYWALWSNDPENFGATIHLVDEGVDTGLALCYARPDRSPEDNFMTYPLLQQAAALPELVKILKGLPGGILRTETGSDTAPSRQWYHPTLLQYVAGRLRGIK